MMRHANTSRKSARTEIKSNRWHALQTLESRVLLSAIPLAATTNFPLFTNDTTPTIVGTVGNITAGVQVAILHHNGAPVGSFAAQTDGAGHWTFTLPNPDALTDGRYDVVVTASANGGSDSGELDLADSLYIDTVSPNVSVTDVIRNTSHPTLVGTVGADATSLSVTVNGATYTSDLGDVVLTGTGHWSLLLPSTADGLYAISATATDSVGNANTATGHLLVDTLTPQVTINSGQLPATITANTTLTGTFSDANIASVFVTLDNRSGGTFSFTALLGTGGTWSAPITITNLPDGHYDVSATVTDLAANSTTIAGAQLTNAAISGDTAVIGFRQPR